MPSTITTASPPAIRVTFDSSELDSSTSTVTLYRTADGQTSQVRTAIALFAAGGFTAFDAEAPVGVPVTYRAMQFDSDGNQIAYTASVTASIAAPATWTAWISDPLDETSALQVVLADSAGADPKRTIPGTVYQIGPDAHLLAGVQGKIVGLDMSFYTNSDGADAAILDLIARTSGQVLIRTGPAFGTLIPRALYCFAGTATPSYMNGDGSAWTNQVSELSPTTQGIAVSNASWQDVIDAFDTWADFNAAFASWLDAEQAFDI